MEKGTEKGKGGLKPGTLLQNGKYRIVRYISQGGFGCTYEAEHTMFNERVAIKELFISEYCNRDNKTGIISVGVSSKQGLIDRMYKKFIDEARAQRKMHHPNIVRVIDVFEENSTAFYVMDYIDGDSLETVISKRKTPMSEQEAVGYIKMVADALEYVHSQKRLHLDVKPGNIMIDKNGKAILIDFGASKQYDEQGSNKSTTVGFTRGYAPIEQMGGNLNTFSPATDIFALGSTLYRLLSGAVPTDALDRSSGVMTLKPLPAGISPATRRAVECAMNISAPARPQTIQEFLYILSGSGFGESEGAATELLGGGGAGIPPTGPISNPYQGYGTNSQPGYGSNSQPGGGYGGYSNGGESEKKSGSSRMPVYIGICLAIIAFGVALLVMRGCGNGAEAGYIDSVSEDSTVYDSSTNVVVPEGFVDLGLSKYWAKSNLREDDGCTLLTLDEVEELTPQDSAFVDTSWINRYMLPTEEEWRELRDKCIWEWCMSPAGYKVTGKTREFIFIPADGIEVTEGGKHVRYGGSEYGDYWTSTKGSLFTFQATKVEYDKVTQGERYSARLVYDPRN